MMANFEAWCFLFVGVYMGLKGVPPLSPWIGFVCGAMIFVLSLIRIVG